MYAYRHVYSYAADFLTDILTYDQVSLPFVLHYKLPNSSLMVSDYINLTSPLDELSIMPLNREHKLY